MGKQGKAAKKGNDQQQQASSSKGEQPKVQVKTVEELSKEEVKIADFQREHPFAERLADSLDCRKRHPDCVPLIIERATDFKDIKQIDNCKYLFNGKSKTAQAMVRTQQHVQAKKMWFYVHMPDNRLKMIYPQSPINVLYQRYQRSDGNLYIFYSDKNLINTQSTFMTIIQILAVILFFLYLYVYFFGAEDLLRFFGVQIQMPDPSTIPTQEDAAAAAAGESYSEGLSQDASGGVEEQIEL